MVGKKLWDGRRKETRWTGYRMGWVDRPAVGHRENKDTKGCGWVETCENRKGRDSQRHKQLIGINNTYQILGFRLRKYICKRSRQKDQVDREKEAETERGTD